MSRVYQQRNLSKKVLNLKKSLQENIFGQDEAINSVVDYITISAAGLNDKEKPLGSFLFMGPTGVGKTELAKELAKKLQMHFERFDMSEYGSESSANNLIGGAAGLVGYQEGGLLTNAILEHPNSVVLFDEVEKADTKVLTMFLQIMDYGKLTSSKGEKVDFRKTIIIFTSNLGAIKTRKRTIGFGSTTYTDIENDMGEYLTPEFRARINKVIEFNPFSEKNAKSIIYKYFLEINEMLKDKRILVAPTDDLVDKYISMSDSSLGARELQNIVTQNAKVIISKEIVSGNLPNYSKVLFDWDDESDKFSYRIEVSDIKKELDVLNYSENTEDIFYDYNEAMDYAKNNPGEIITRSTCGNGWMVKE